MWWLIIAIAQHPVFFKMYWSIWEYGKKPSREPKLSYYENKFVIFKSLASWWYIVYLCYKAEASKVYDKKLQWLCFQHVESLPSKENVVSTCYYISTTRLETYIVVFHHWNGQSFIVVILSMLGSCFTCYSRFSDHLSL